MTARLRDLSHVRILLLPVPAGSCNFRPSANHDQRDNRSSRRLVHPESPRRVEARTCASGEFAIAFIVAELASSCAFSAKSFAVDGAVDAPAFRKAPSSMAPIT